MTSEGSYNLAAKMMLLTFNAYFQIMVTGVWCHGHGSAKCVVVFLRIALENII